jgi:hypothetical protein
MKKAGAACPSTLDFFSSFIPHLILLRALFVQVRRTRAAFRSLCEKRANERWRLKRCLRESQMHYQLYLSKDVARCIRLPFISISLSTSIPFSFTTPVPLALTLLLYLSICMPLSLSLTLTRRRSHSYL